MRSRGQLGNDTAEDAMHVLRQDHEGAQAYVIATSFEDSG